MEKVTEIAVSLVLNCFDNLKITLHLQFVFGGFLTALGWKALACVYVA